MDLKDVFRYEIEHSKVDPSEALDSRGDDVTTIKCHGKLVLEFKDKVEAIFKETPFHGRIIVDLSDVSYMDSAGLGALMRLKLSAMKHGGVSVSYVEMTPRVRQLLSITNLTEWFTS